LKSHRRAEAFQGYPGQWNRQWNNHAAFFKRCVIKESVGRGAELREGGRNMSAQKIVRIAFKQ